MERKDLYVGGQFSLEDILDYLEEGDTVKFVKDTFDSYAWSIHNGVTAEYTGVDSFADYMFNTTEGSTKYFSRPFGRGVMVEIVGLYLATCEDPEEESTEKEYTYTLTEHNLVLCYGDEVETVDSTHPEFKQIRQDVFNEDFESALTRISPVKAITEYTSGLLNIANGEVKYSDTVITNKLVSKVIDMMRAGSEDFVNYANFLKLVMEQPSYTTRQRLMDFVAADKIKITEQGKVIAFKNVNNDYYDKHSRKFRNMVGDEPSMPRHAVDDDHSKTCSAGLHVCSPYYLTSMWGTSGKTMKVEVDPRDFVAVPYDYNDSKARVCKYKVIEDVTDKLKEYL